MHEFGAGEGNSIRVLLVDDEKNVRLALRRLLNAYPDIDVAGEASNGAEAVARVAELDPDVVLMDYRMVPTNGLAATRTIKRRRDPPRVVLLTIVAGIESDASASGVDALLLKGCPKEALLDSIRGASGVV